MIRKRHLKVTSKSKAFMGLAILISLISLKTLAQQNGGGTFGNSTNPAEQDTLDIAPNPNATDNSSGAAASAGADAGNKQVAPNEDAEEFRPAPKMGPRFPSQPVTNTDPGQAVSIPVIGGEPIPADQAFDEEGAEDMGQGLGEQSDFVDSEANAEDEFAKRMMELNEEVLNREFYPVFIYEDRDRRDPFMPILQSRQSYLERSGGPSGLLQYDISQLALKAIAWSSKEPKALFRDPKANIYMVKKNDLIGRNNGYIEDIREGEVIIVESRAVKGGQKFYSTQILRVGR